MLNAKSAYSIMFNKEAQVAPVAKSRGVFESFIKNLSTLRQQLNPQIQLVNQVAKYENQLKQLMNNAYTGKIHNKVRDALETRLQALNNQIVQPLVNTNAQDTTKLKQLQQGITEFLTKAFGTTQQSQGQPVSPATQQTQTGTAPILGTPVPAGTSSAGQAGNWVGRKLKTPGRAIGKAWQGVKNVARDFGQGFSQAESDKTILTGSLSSAKHFFK